MKKSILFFLFVFFTSIQANAYTINTTPNFVIPKPSRSADAYGDAWNTAYNAQMDTADAAIKSALDLKQASLSTISWFNRSAADGMPSQNTVNGSGCIQINDNASGFMALSHYHYGAMLYFKDASNQFEVWGTDTNSSNYLMPILTFVAIKNDTRISLRKSDDTDSLLMHFVSGTPDYVWLTTEQNGSQIRIQPKSGNIVFGTAATDNRKVYVASAKTLVDATPTAIVDIACPAGAMIGGRIKYTVRCLTDGGEYQATTGAVIFAAVNKGNTITSSVVDSTETTTAHSSGTLTVAATVTNSNGASGKITINLAADSNLTPSTLNCYFEVENDAGTTVTPL